MASPNPIIRNTVSSIIAAFGVIDVPISQWPALIPALLTNVLKTETAVETKIASLQVCEVILLTTYRMSK